MNTYKIFEFKGLCQIKWNLVAKSGAGKLFCKGSGASAKEFVSAGGFTVLEGSTVSDHIVPSLETRGKTYFNLRNALVKEGIISDRKFTRDYEFNAPSAASAVVLGHTSNGNIDWKTADGVKLKDI